MRSTSEFARVCAVVGLFALTACDAPTEPSPEVRPGFAKGGNPGSPGGGQGGEEPSAYTLTLVEGVCVFSCSADGFSGINGAGLIVGGLDGEATFWDADLTPVPLGQLGGDHTFANAIDAGGTKIVGEWSAPGSDMFPAVWTLSGTTVVASGLLPLPTGATTGNALGVNDIGQAVGLAGTGSAPFGVLWEADGTPRALGNLPGYTSGWAEAINNTGHVVGFAQSYSLPTRAVLWIVDASSVTTVDLTPSGADRARATDLTEVVGGELSVVGTTTTAGTSRRTVWTVDALSGDVLDVVYGPETVHPRMRVNADLEVAGGYEVWDPVAGGVDALPVLSDRCLGQGALDINDAGVIVGRVGERYRGGCVTRLAIWTPVAP